MDKSTMQPQAISVYGVAVLECRGEVTALAVRSAVRSASELSDFRRGLPILVEFSARHSVPSVAEVAMIADEIAASADQIGPVAMVVRPRVFLRLTRELAPEHLDSLHMRFFSEVQEAFLWLKLNTMRQQELLQRCPNGNPAAWTC